MNMKQRGRFIQCCYTVAIVLLVGGFSPRAEAQTPAPDSLKKPLPAIQLKEYTIVGLSRISLPQKHRIELPVMVRTAWSQNPGLSQKSQPIRVFHFARKKPTMVLSAETARLTARVGYGSFQTLQGDVFFYPKLNRLTPFAKLHYLTSKGHLEGANRTELGFTLGTNGTLWSGSRLESQLFFNTFKQGLWGPFYQQRGETFIRNTSQGGLIHINQEWDNGFSLSGEGGYLEQHHRLVQNTTQTMVNGSGRLEYTRGQLSLTLAGSFVHTATQQTTFLMPPLDSTLFDVTHQIVEGELGVSHSISFVNYQVGIRVQRVDSSGNALNSQSVFPFFRAGFLLGKTAKLHAEYGSGYQLPTLNRLVLPHIPAEPERFTPVYYRSRWDVTLRLSPISPLAVDYRLRLANVEHLPVIVPAAPLAANVPPLWRVSFAPGGSVTTHTLKASINLKRAFRLRAEVRLNQSAVDSLPDKQLPYTPRFTGTAGVTWNFTPTAQFQLTVNYTGTRYDDIRNTRSLSPYVLFNVEGRVQVMQRVSIRAWGKNLFNQQYEYWRNFEAPGIHFGVSVEFRY